MFNRDYTQEIEMAPPTKRVPWPLAVLILAVLAAGVTWFASVELRAYRQLHDRASPAMMAQSPIVHPTKTAKALTPHHAAQPEHPVG